MNGIVLVGFMGTGKSVVGKQLAARLQCPFVDSDEWIVRHAGKSITRIFAEDGEPVFRQLETEALQALARMGVAPVVATGGGIVLAERNWEYLHQIGEVVCLTASPETVLQRVGEATDRPLLAGTKEEVAGRIARLLAERAPAYAKADWQCPTDHRTPAEIAALIIERRKKIERKGTEEHA